jgi:hypothetical protein
MPVDTINELGQPKQQTKTDEKGVNDGTNQKGIFVGALLET